MDTPTEPRNNKIAVAITDRERAAVDFIAAHRGTDRSNLLREMGVSQIVREFDRLLAMLPPARDRVAA